MAGDLKRYVPPLSIVPPEGGDVIWREMSKGVSHVTCVQEEGGGKSSWKAVWGVTPPAKNWNPVRGRNLRVKGVVYLDFAKNT